MKRRLVCIMCSLCMTLSMFQQMAFAADEWYHDAVQFVYNGEITNESAKDTFSPDAALTRCAMWDLLKNMDRHMNTESTEIDDSISAEDWVIKNNISDGTDPDRILSRQEMITMLYRYEQSKGGGLFGSYMINMGMYKDIQYTAEWSTEAFVWAKINSVMVGTAEDELSPNGDATYAQAAKVIMNYCSLNDKQDKDIAE